MFKLNKIITNFIRMRLLFFTPLIIFCFCSNSSAVKHPKFEFVSSYKMNTGLDFMQFFVNDNGQYESYLSSIKADSVSLEIKEKLSPDFDKYTYVFSCFEIESIEYNPKKELSAGPDACYTWYQKKYHIASCKMKTAKTNGTMKIYKLEKDGTFGFKEDC